ncbi:MAG: DUF2339 domain-containing protein [Lachnospiraceae bacterium]|nr:DUF2339 domain-containing protein [Ruminococcus sp.]MCM1274816.1 DUF2339 domain-containing protein [Lachnospiraceae bacterium]
MNEPNNNPNGQKGAPTGGELFVGMNLLSKIGVIFIIVGVIAFSAASEGFLHVGVRLALVIALGLIMLGAGELFYCKGSHVFANALIFGGVAELFICSLIGRYGFGILSGGGAVGVGLGAAAVGFLLSARYGSQGLLIVTTLFAVLPVFAFTPSSYWALAVYLVAVHAANAVFARRNAFNAAYAVGIAAAVIEPLLLELPSGNPRLDANAAAVVTAVFAVCCAVCYAGGLLLNAAQSSGMLKPSETAMLSLTLSAAVLFTNAPLLGVSVATAGAALLVLAVIFAVVAVVFSLKGSEKCSVNTVMYNFILISVTWALLDLFTVNFPRYIALHVLAAAVLVIGVLFDRKLFRGWGGALLALAEFFFFGLLLFNKTTGERLTATLVNLALWFGVMAVFIAKRKHENTLFRVYTFAAFLNAGFLCSDMVNRYLVNALYDADFWSNPAERLSFSALLCAVPWLVLGFIAGKPKYMRVWGMVSSFTLYIIGLLNLLAANVIEALNRSIGGHEMDIAGVIATIAVNAASVLPVLDMALQIRGKAPKFAKAVGLVVSGYALMSLTTILGTNDYVTFTSFIISIIYIVTAAVWIIVGFKRLNALLRRFGLALALLSSAKLFLFDFSNINNMGRTLLFIGFGVTLLCIAFGYGIAEKKLKDSGK